MPLDPSIFFQGAALRQANDARLQNTIQGAIERLYAARQKQMEIDSDPERQLFESVSRVVSGQGTPEDAIRIQAQSALEGQKTQYTKDEMGNLVPSTGPSLYDRVYGQGKPSAYKPIYPSEQELGQIGQADFTGIKIPQVDMNAPIQGGAVRPPMPPDGYKGVLDRLMAQDVLSPDAIAGAGRYTGSPAQQKKTGEANIDIAQKKIEAGITPTQKGAETLETERAKTVAANEGKVAALSSMIDELEAFQPNIEKLPSGAIQSMAASATNLAGVPSNKALAQARMESTFPVLLSNAKQLVRTAGEGTFTDADQRIINDMLFSKNDANEVKAEKYNTLVDIFKRTRSRLTGSTEKYMGERKGSPAFKYIGVKQ
jgi:hypothetical protein